MTLRIVTFNVCELRGAPKSIIVPVKVPQPFMHMRVSTSDISYVGLEVLHINSIKSYYRGE